MVALFTQTWTVCECGAEMHLCNYHVVRIVPEIRSDMYVASEWDADTVGAREQQTCLLTLLNWACRLARSRRFTSDSVATPGCASKL